MKDHEKTYSTDPQKIKLANVPIIYRSVIRSGEALSSEYNQKQVKEWLSRGDQLTEDQRHYIFAIYMELARSVEHIGQARLKLSNHPEEIFNPSDNGVFDAGILKRLLCPPQTWQIK